MIKTIKTSDYGKQYTTVSPQQKQQYPSGPTTPMPFSSLLQTYQSQTFIATEIITSLKNISFANRMRDKRLTNSENNQCMKTIVSHLNMYFHSKEYIVLNDR